jgi:hypothetical protein
MNGLFQLACELGLLLWETLCCLDGDVDSP